MIASNNSSKRTVLIQFKVFATSNMTLATHQGALEKAQPELVGIV